MFIRAVVWWRKRGLWVSVGVGRRILMGGFGVVVVGGDGGVEVDVEVDVDIDIVFFRFRCEGVRRYLLGLVMYGGICVYMYVSGKECQLD